MRTLQGPLRHEHQRKWREGESLEVEKTQQSSRLMLQSILCMMPQVQNEYTQGYSNHPWCNEYQQNNYSLFVGDNKSYCRIVLLTYKPQWHGHNDGVYTHYTIDLWPKDSNFTTSSLARRLRALEQPTVRNSKEVIWRTAIKRFFELKNYGINIGEHLPIYYGNFFFSNLSIIKPCDALHWT